MRDKLFRELIKSIRQGGAILREHRSKNLYPGRKLLEKMRVGPYKCFWERDAEDRISKMIEDSKLTLKPKT